MTTISFTGTINLQLTDESRPAPIPLAASLTYTEKTLVDFSYAATQTNVALAQGTVTAPKWILVQVTEGAVSLSWLSDGTGPTVVKANAAPPPTDPGTLLLMTYSPGAGQLYLSCTGPARGRIWLFE